MLLNLPIGRKPKEKSLHALALGLLGTMSQKPRVPSPISYHQQLKVFLVVYLSTSRRRNVDVQLL